MILPPPIWTKGPHQPTLLPGEIHLWRASLTDPVARERCLAVLSAEERLRAERFAFDRDRDQFVVSHGALRMVLSRYACVDPRALEFASGENGKPRLMQRFTDLRFNLSHTDGLALIALARGREVGVDVERVDREMVFEDIAEHYFEPCEVWDLRIAPDGEKAARFFDVWTRKEAQLKAGGQGLAALAALPKSPFAVRNLTPADGYAGAVASEGDDWRLACWDWSL